METTARRQEFAPPPTPGLLRAFILAILAHTVLLVALTAGVQWKRETVQQAVEAELWSAIPVQAAPPAPEPEPQPEPPKPEPVVKPKPEPKPDPGPTPAEIKAQADIAIAKEKEKAKLLKEKQLALEKEKLAKEKLELDKKKQAELDKQKQAKLEQEKKDKEKQDKLKKEQADKLAAEKDKQQRKLDQQAEANAAKSREDQIKRMERLAGGTSGGGSTPGGSSAAQSSGPSAGYAGRIVARIKPNITYPDNIDGNPRVEVDIRTSPSGNILSARITQSSGVKSWDDAVIRAIEKTEVLPKDIDGTVPRSLLIGFRPKD